jgi:hypothetical protein|tara:strand:+ start:467 stop:679 length:213 start_codon:yes stop_codon:yes gene_type:complete
MFKWIKEIFSAGGDTKVEATAEPKRARVKGRYKADNKSTADVNEAWVGGKAPMTAKQKRIAAKKALLKRK